MTRTLRAVLVTLGDPNRLSGGYLYHLKMKELAATNDARLDIVGLPERPLPLRALSAFRALQSAARDADVLLIDSIVAASTLPALVRSPRLRVVASIHQPPGGVDSSGPARFAQRIFDVAAYRRCARLIVASGLLCEEVLRSGIDARRIAVVEPGSDGAVVAGGEDRDSLRHGRAAAVVCVANWLPRKGIADLVAALERMPSDAVTLHLAGEATDRHYSARINDLLARPALQGRVVVHGAVTRDRVAALYSAADIFCLPSRDEPFGTVYGEALRAGLPIVGWAAGNLPNLVTDGVEGRLLAVGDLDGLARALTDLATDRETRQRMADSAAARGSRLPAWEQSANAFFAVLRDVVYPIK